MPFLFTCPHCQTKTRVEDQYSGQKGECVTCGGAIKVPLFAATDGVGSEESKRPVQWLAAAGVLLVILGCALVLMFKFSGGTIKRLANNKTKNDSIKNLEKIAAALNAYAQKYGTYPPPAILDANNQPLLSWRVLILPFLGEDRLYAQFDLTKPWDAQNMDARYSMPDVFLHPSSRNQGWSTESDYYLIVGKGTLFPASGPLGPDDVLDSPAQTILVAEGKPDVISGIWTAPIDMNFGKMTGQINGPAQDDLGGELIEDGATMATVDGRGHFLPAATSPVTVNSMITPSGGEPLRDDTLD